MSIGVIDEATPAKGLSLSYLHPNIVYKNHEHKASCKGRYKTENDLSKFRTDTRLHNGYALGYKNPTPSMILIMSVVMRLFSLPAKFAPDGLLEVF